MTTTYTIQRLLQHGPMRRRELVEVTGWPKRRVDKALYATTCDGRVEEVKVPGRRDHVYRLPAGHFLPNLEAAR